MLIILSTEKYKRTPISWQGKEVGDVGYVTVRDASAITVRSFASRKIALKLQKVVGKEKFKLVYVESIYVKPQYRKKRIAQKTLRALERNKPVLMLFVIMNSRQSDADRPENRITQKDRIEAYQKMGYTVLVDKDVYAYRFSK